MPLITGWGGAGGWGGMSERSAETRVISGAGRV